MEKHVYPHLSETVYKDRLPNGLSIAVVHRPGFEKKLAYFVTDYGSIHTEFSVDGKTCHAPAGVAHFLEHKMFDMPWGEVSGEFARLGASPNAFTGYDMTAYHFSCSENFERCLELLLDFVSTAYFTPESVAKEQGIIGQEIDMNLDSPDTRGFELLMGAMYREHPVSVPILGTRQTIAQITDRTLNDCHSAFYRPDNMLLCVVGDVDPEQVRQIALQYTKAAPVAKVTARRRWDEEMTCPEHFVSDQMEVAMPTFQLGYKCEPLGTGEDAVKQEIIGDLAAEALFGESSPLYLKLYEDGLIDPSFGGGFETIEGMAMLSASGDSDDPEAVRDAIAEYAEKLLEAGISEEDFLRMKRSAIGRRVRALDSFDTTCFRICAYHFSGFDYFDFPRIYQAVTTKDVLEFIQRVITPHRCCLSVIYPLD